MINKIYRFVGIVVVLVLSWASLGFCGIVTVSGTTTVFTSIKAGINACPVGGTVGSNTVTVTGVVSNARATTIFQHIACPSHIYGTVTEQDGYSPIPNASINIMQHSQDMSLSTSDSSLSGTETTLEGGGSGTTTVAVGFNNTGTITIDSYSPALGSQSVEAVVVVVSKQRIATVDAPATLIAVGGTEVHIPAGVFTQTMDIIINENPNEGNYGIANEGLAGTQQEIVPEMVREFIARNTNGEDIHTFSSPIRIAIPYPAQWSSAQLSRLHVYWLNPETNSWQRASGTETIDTVNHRIILETMHFSILTGVLEGFLSMESGATTVSPTSVDRSGTNTTTISAVFYHTENPSIASFTVIFKVRGTDMATITLVDAKKHGEAGLEITGANGTYTATYIWDPSSTCTTGLYDLYFHVTDGMDTVTDDFGYNLDELTIISSGTPTITITHPTTLGAEADSSYLIGWIDSDPDNNATISLCYNTDNTGTNGTLIAGGISEDDETDTYKWDTSMLSQDSSYYIYALIKDGNSTVCSLSTCPVIIDHRKSDSTRLAWHDNGVWLNGDIHMHTIHSDGEKTASEIAQKARSYGLDFIAITDHGDSGNIGSTEYHKAILNARGTVSELMILEGWNGMCPGQMMADMPA